MLLIQIPPSQRDVVENDAKDGEPGTASLTASQQKNSKIPSGKNGQTVQSPISSKKPELTDLIAAMASSKGDTISMSVC